MKSEIVHFTRLPAQLFLEAHTVWWSILWDKSGVFSETNLIWSQLKCKILEDLDQCTLHLQQRKFASRAASWPTPKCKEAVLCSLLTCCILCEPTIWYKFFCIVAPDSFLIVNTMHRNTHKASTGQGATWTMHSVRFHLNLHFVASMFSANRAAQTQSP